MGRARGGSKRTQPLGVAQNKKFGEETGEAEPRVIPGGGGPGGGGGEAVGCQNGDSAAIILREKPETFSAVPQRYPRPEGPIHWGWPRIQKTLRGWLAPDTETFEGGGGERTFSRLLNLDEKIIVSRKWGPLREEAEKRGGTKRGLGIDVAKEKTPRIFGGRRAGRGPP